MKDNKDGEITVYADELRSILLRSVDHVEKPDNLGELLNRLQEDAGVKAKKISLKTCNELLYIHNFNYEETLAELLAD